MEGMGADDTCLTVIGFVTDRAKWCGWNTELCSCETVGTLTHGQPGLRTNTHCFFSSTADFVG